MANDHEEDVDMLDSEHECHEVGPSLLPAPIANAISLVTRSSALYLRLGTFIGGLALDGARITTLTGLELSRAIVEGVLGRAGRDVADRSRGELGRADAEGLLEKSIATLHTTITTISFAASTGFHFSSTALSSAGDVSQQLLSTLDSILGSTDSSRAIASIITLIRREFENPATGQPGERVGLVDLLVGICGLALLQRWCKRLTDLEAKDKKVEDIVWDVVILNDGRRADIAARIGQYGETSTSIPGHETDATTSFMALSSSDELIRTIERTSTTGDYQAEDDWAEAHLRENIVRNLPANASVSIKTDISTTKTITVEITGSQPLDLAPPDGAEIIEQTAHQVDPISTEISALTSEQKIALLVPRYRVVYRIIKNRFRSTDIHAGEDELAIEDDMGEKMDYAPLKQIGTRESKENAHIHSNNPDGFTRSKEGSQFLFSPSSSPEPEEIADKNADKANAQNRRRSDAKIDSSSTFVPVSSPTANQKRLRKPMTTSSASGSEAPSISQAKRSRPPLAKKMNSETSENGKRKGGLRDALRRGSGTTLSSLWGKDVSPPVPEKSTTVRKPAQLKPAWSGCQPVKKAHSTANKAGSSPGSLLPVPQRASGNSGSRDGKLQKGVNRALVPGRDAPRPPQRGNPNYFSSRDLGRFESQEQPSSPSRASYYEIHERRRNSTVSQTDTYSIHSADTRPGSPTAFRAQLRTQSNLMRSRSEKNMNLAAPQSQSPNKHRRVKSNVPSIYTLNTNYSDTSLSLVSHINKGAYDAEEALNTLSRTGHIDGLFPQHHIVRNITRFIRFASASYGSHFMRVMGITSAPGSQRLGIDHDHHYEHHSFSHHTQLPASTILLSSFVDPQGGTDSTGETNTNVPMVHFVSLDHDSRAVVLTCRGTLGFEDVLTDMTCDYDDLYLRGDAYKVHKGIHASAVRLLSGNGSRVLATLATALEEFPDYGLVMCGHSLGGAVVALLAIMISEPASPPSSSFVTSTTQYRTPPQRLLTYSTSNSSQAPPTEVHLPSGRPIHVYAYGPPATLSPSLRLATRGLITTIINGQDTVPFLSLGVLHDLQAIALAFKTDDSGAKGEVRARVWAGLTSGFVDKWYGNRGMDGGGGGVDEDDEWAYSALKALRASMLSQKLVPPGECFIVETMPVLQRDAFTVGSRPDGREGAGAGLGRPATRAVLRFVRDVERRFGEMRFGGSMLLDHSPGRYEASLAALGKGVLR